LIESVDGEDQPAELWELEEGDEDEIFNTNQNDSKDSEGSDSLLALEDSDIEEEELDENDEYDEVAKIEFDVDEPPSMLSVIFPSGVKMKKIHTCKACGREGHNWHTCRKRNVEYILASLGIVPRLAIAIEENLAVVSSSLSIVNSGLALDTISRNVPAVQSPVNVLGKTKKKVARGRDAEQQPRGKSAETKRPKAADVCGKCKQLPGNDNWRHVGNKCDICGTFFHFVCGGPGKSNGRYTCSKCQ
jgi:hypothetical protein